MVMTFLKLFNVYYYVGDKSHQFNGTTGIEQFVKKWNIGEGYTRIINSEYKFIFEAYEPYGVLQSLGLVLNMQ